MASLLSLSLSLLLPSSRAIPEVARRRPPRRNVYYAMSRPPPPTRRRAKDVQKFATICIPSGGIVHEGILAFMYPAHQVSHFNKESKA